jgi:hypothetical protein
MVVFQGAYLLAGSYNGTSFTPSLQFGPSAYRLVGTRNDDTFRSGDGVTYQTGSSSLAVRYIGFHDDGVMFVNASGNYYFISVSLLSNYNAIPINRTDPFVACFLPGTLIATVGGPVAVESLRIGDGVVTADGHVVPVKWIGRQTVVTAFGPSREHAPVLVCEGALGPNQPMRDLRVTSDHALLLDGLLVQAGALVNGTTVRRMTAAEVGERYTVFHVETEGHELILAEGIAAETFVDNVTRRRFDNYAEFEALYGEEDATIAELDLPRVKSARQLPRSIHRRMAERAGAFSADPAEAA